MKPLVSGAEAKRFLEPRTGTYLLFPYRVDAGRARLLPADEMAAEFPKAWKYLKGFEAELRAREGKKFGDDNWHRMGRTQNLDKQEVPKLMVPRLVARLGCFVDDQGHYYCDNVDVGGVVPNRVDDIWFLAGVLNAPVSSTIFDWLSKPFRGDYKSANKQFIAPLPIPKGDRVSRAALSALARQLQESRTAQLDARARLDERLAATARTVWPLEKLLPDVRDISAIEATTPKSVPASERKAWVDDARKGDEESALARIGAGVRLDSMFDVVLADGKLAFRIDEQEAASVFVSDTESALVAAQWRCVALDFEPRGKDDGKRLIDRLRRVATSADPALTAQIVALGDDLTRLDTVIRDDEAQLHDLTCTMFDLSDAERALVARGR